MQCGYANIGSASAPRRVHFRYGGKGPPLLMLHASPMSSRAMLPQMQAVSSLVTAIAPDTPGYGRSAPLPSDADNNGDSLEPYVQALARFCDALGLERIGLYGTATGAQIAIEFSKRHAERVNYLVLDNAADFTDAEQSAITDGYFPDLTPDRLGGHLARAWSVARDQLLFFPWHQAEAERRLVSGLEPRMLDGFARELLQAGPDYARAYRAAFANERAARLRAVTVPTTILRWAGSILKPWTDRFDQHDWPANFRMLPAGPTPAERFKALEASVAGHRSDDQDVQPRVTEDLQWRYQAGSAGALHLRECGDGEPLVVLHAMGGSAETIAPELDALSNDYLCIAPDLPGHGESGVPADDFPAAFGSLLDDLFARYPGAGLAAVGDTAAPACAYAARRGLNAKRWLIDPQSGPANTGGAVSEREFPDLAPRLSGAHWLEAWSMLRLRQLFYPWSDTAPGHALTATPDLEAETLNRRLKSLLAASAVFEPARRWALEQTLAPDEQPADCRWILSGSTPAAEISRRTLPEVRQWQVLTPARR